MILSEPFTVMTSPRANATFEAGEPIVLEARHLPPEIGSIAGVRFFAGTNEIASLTNAPFSFVWTNAAPGEYLLRAIADDTFRRPFRSEYVPIFVQGAGPPVNDNFTNRLSLSGLVARGSKPAVGATLQSGEPRPAPGYGGRTLWWSWTAYDGSPVTISAKNSSAAETSVAVYIGDSIDRLLFVTKGVPEANFFPEAGRTYAIAVEPKNSAELVTLDIAAGDVRVEEVSPNPRVGEPALLTLRGSAARSITNVQVFAGADLIAITDRAPVTLTNEFTKNGFFNLVAIATDARGIRTISAPFLIAVRPANDALSDATELNGFTANADFSSEAATSESFDPVSFGESSHSIWYSWKAPADGFCRLRVGRRTGALGAYLLRSDLSPPTLETMNLTSGAESGELEFVASAGSTYHFLLGAEFSESGRLTLQLRPLNDAFTHRAHVNGYLTEQVFRPINGRLETNEPAIPNLAFTNRSSAWWSWTAPATGVARIDTVPSNAPVALSVFTGTDLTELALLGQSSQAGFLEFQAEEGNVYHIRAIGRAEVKLRGKHSDHAPRRAAGSTGEQPAFPNSCSCAT